MKISPFIILIYLFLIIPVWANGNFFPDYKVSLNGGEVFINEKRITNSNLKKNPDGNIISPKDKLTSGENGYILLENNLNHSIIVPPYTEIQFLPSSYDNHTYILLKKGRIILKNKSNHKIHLQVNNDILSFTKGIAYVNSIGNTDHFLLLSGSMHYLSHNKFKIILNGSQGISINYKKSELTHFIPSKIDSLFIFNAADKLFKYSAVELFYEFTSIVQVLNQSEPVLIENFLPPKTEDVYVRVLTPNHFVTIDNHTFKINEDKKQYFKIDKGIHFFEWNEQVTSVLVKDFRQIVVSINDDDSYLKEKKGNQSSPVFDLEKPSSHKKLSSQKTKPIKKIQKKIKSQFPKMGQYRLVKKYGNKSFPLGLPLGLIVNNEKLFVADSADHQIKRFDENGFSNFFGDYFQSPNCIRHKKEHYIVSDTKQNLVILFDKIFRKKITIGSDQNLSKPIGVDYDGRAIYIADSGNDAVKKFENGKMELLGEKLNLKKPNDVFITAGKNVIISDAGNRRILLLTKNNSLVKSIDIDYQPGLMTEDEQNQIYITDPQGHQVNIYDKNLSFVSFLKIKGATPYGVDVEEGLVYVSLSNIQIVNVYEKIK